MDAHRRHLPGHRHPAAHALAQPALHRGHRHRDPRPPARCCSRASAARSASSCGSEVTKDTAESVAAAAARPARGLAGAGRLPGLARAASRCADLFERLRKRGFRRLLAGEEAVELDGLEPARGARRRRRHARAGGPARRRARTARPPGRLAGDGLRRGRRAAPSCAWSGGRRAALLGGLRLRALRARLRGAAAAPLLLQQPLRRLPDLPRLRQPHRGRPGPRDPGQGALAGARARSSPGTSRTTRRPQAELRRFARRRGIPMDTPWSDLPEEHRRLVLEGDEEFQGVVGFFRWLETKKYKVQVRVFLSRYRGYQVCPACHGARLRPEALRRAGGRAAASTRSARSPCARRCAFLARLELDETDARGGGQGAVRARAAAAATWPTSGLDYLTLDRPFGIALRRRGPAHRAGHRAGHGAGGHALRPRRALDRPAPARHRPADRRPEGAARPGQHRAGGRARPRHHARSRTTSIDLGPGRGRAGRPRRLPGQPTPS